MGVRGSKDFSKKKRSTISEGTKRGRESPEAIWRRFLKGLIAHKERPSRFIQYTYFHSPSVIRSKRPWPFAKANRVRLGGTSNLVPWAIPRLDGSRRYLETFKAARRLRSPRWMSALDGIGSLELQTAQGTGPSIIFLFSRLGACFFIWHLRLGCTKFNLLRRNVSALKVFNFSAVNVRNRRREHVTEPGNGFLVR